MRWILALLRFTLLALAALVLGLAGLALALEHGGWLRGRVRRELSARLGEPVEVRAVHLSWLDAALEIEDLSFGLPGTRIDRVRVVLRAGEDGLPRPALIEIVGGRVALGPELESRLEARAASDAAGAAPGRPAVPLPALVVRDVQLDLAHPDWGEIPLGSVQARFVPDARGSARLEGRIRPSLADERRDVRRGSAVVFLTGSETAGGELELEVACEGVPISLEHLPQDTPLEPLRQGGLRGSIAISGRVQLPLATPWEARGELRARLSRGELTVPGSDQAVTEVTIEMEARCAPGPEEDFSSAGAWKASAHATASWRGAALDSWAVYGTHAGDGLAARAWARAGELPADLETLAALQLSGAVERTWDALDPRGTCEIVAAVELPHESSARALVEVIADGSTDVTYHGWPSRISGRPQGFPMPVERVAGRLVIAYDRTRPSPLLLALVGVRGEHGAVPAGERLATIDGLIRAPPDAPPRSPAEYSLRLAGRGIPVDGGGVPSGLAGLDGTEWIWPTFQPVGGVASFRSVLRREGDEARLGARFSIDFSGTSLVWNELPVPMTAVDGHLELLFDPRLGWGAAFRAEGRTLTADRVEVAGRFQRQARRPAGSVVDDMDGLEELAVALENVALRGLDREVVVGVLPALGAALDQLAPAGKVDARLSRSRAFGQSEGSFVVEVVPREVQFAPQAFRVPTRNVRGRVLVEGGRVLARPVGASEVTPVRTRLTPLVGEWPGGVLVACEADLGGEYGQGRLRVLASGVAPLNRSVVGALRAAFEAPGTGYAGLDLAALSVDGRVDVEGRVELATAGEAPPRSRFRVWLRDNDFRIAPPSGPDEAGGFGLARLHGVLDQREGVLSGAGIRARLGATPVVLREARFELADGGYRLETSPSARGLPLDREHLRFFLDPETVDALVDGLGFGGSVDIDNARLVLAGAPSGPGSVRFEGRVRPRGLHVDFGLPFDVESAAVSVESLVFEQGHVRAWAGVENLNGSLAGRRLERGRLQLTYVEPHLSILDLDGALEGGRLADLGQAGDRGGPAFSLDLQEPFPFDVGLRLEDVEVEGLLRGLFESEFASRGVLSGDLRLNGSLERIREIVGEGSLNLRDTTLWSIPVMRALFSQLGFDDTAVFERMRTRFQLREGVVHMDDIEVYSPLLQLVGSGTLDLEGRLHHDLEVRYSLVDRLGPFTRLVYWIQNNLLRLAVRGDMSRPRVEIQGVLSVLQGTGATGRDLPLPSLTPMPPRF